MVVALDFYGNNDDYKDYDLVLFFFQLLLAFTKRKWHAHLVPLILA